MPEKVGSTDQYDKPVQFPRDVEMVHKKIRTITVANIPSFLVDGKQSDEERGVYHLPQIMGKINAGDYTVDKDNNIKITLSVNEQGSRAKALGLIEHNTSYTISLNDICAAILCSDAKEKSLWAKYLYTKEKISKGHALAVLMDEDVKLDANHAFQVLGDYLKTPEYTNASMPKKLLDKLLITISGNKGLSQTMVNHLKQGKRGEMLLLDASAITKINRILAYAKTQEEDAVVNTLKQQLLAAESEIIKKPGYPRPSDIQPSHRKAIADFFADSKKYLMNKDALNRNYTQRTGDLLVLLKTAVPDFAQYTFYNQDSGSQDPEYLGLEPHTVQNNQEIRKQARNRNVRKYAIALGQYHMITECGYEAYEITFDPQSGISYPADFDNSMGHLMNYQLDMEVNQRVHMQSEPYSGSLEKMEKFEKICLEGLRRTDYKYTTQNPEGKTGLQQFRTHYEIYQKKTTEIQILENQMLTKLNSIWTNDILPSLAESPNSIVLPQTGELAQDRFMELHAKLQETVGLSLDEEEEYVILLSCFSKPEIASLYNDTGSRVDTLKKGFARDPQVLHSFEEALLSVQFTIMKHGGNSVIPTSSDQQNILAMISNIQSNTRLPGKDYTGTVLGETPLPKPDPRFLKYVSNRAFDDIQQEGLFIASNDGKQWYAPKLHRAQSANESARAEINYDLTQMKNSGTFVGKAAYTSMSVVLGALGPLTKILTSPVTIPQQIDLAFTSDPFERKRKKDAIDTGFFSQFLSATSLPDVMSNFFVEGSAPSGVGDIVTGNMKIDGMNFAGHLSRTLMDVYLLIGGGGAIASKITPSLTKLGLSGKLLQYTANSLGTMGMGSLLHLSDHLETANDAGLQKGEVIAYGMFATALESAIESAGGLTASSFNKEAIVHEGLQYINTSAIKRVQRAGFALGKDGVFETGEEIVNQKVMDITHALLNEYRKTAFPASTFGDYIELSILAGLAGGIISGSVESDAVQQAKGLMSLLTSHEGLSTVEVMRKTLETDAGMSRLEAILTNAGYESTQASEMAQRIKEIIFDTPLDNALERQGLTKEELLDLRASATFENIDPERVSIEYSSVRGYDIFTVKVYNEGNTATVQYELRCKEGDRFLHNEYLILDAEMRQQGGNALRILGNQIKKAKEIGCHSIYGTCAGPDASEDPNMPQFNGAYTWGVMGFDFDATNEMGVRVHGARFTGVVSRQRSAMQRSKGVATLYDLLQQPDGRKYRKDNSFTFQGKFDLADGSNSMKQFEAYKAEKENSTPSANPDAPQSSETIDEASAREIPPSLLKQIKAIYHMPQGSQEGSHLIVLQNGRQFQVGDTSTETVELLPGMSTQSLRPITESVSDFISGLVLSPTKLMNDMDFVSTLTITDSNGNDVMLEDVGNVESLVGTTLTITSSKSGRSKPFVIESVSTPIGEGGYGMVYIVTGVFGNGSTASGALHPGRKIQCAIKVINRNRGREIASIYKNSAEKHKVIQRLGLSTYTTYRPVENNKNILAMTLLSTPDQYCFSLNNIGRDISQINAGGAHVSPESLDRVIQKLDSIFEVCNRHYIQINHDAFFFMLNKVTGELDVMIGDFDNVVTKHMYLLHSGNNPERVASVVQGVRDTNTYEKSLARKKLAKILGYEIPEFDLPVPENADSRTHADWRRIYENMNLIEDTQRQERMKSLIDQIQPGIPEEQKKVLIEILMGVHTTDNSIDEEQAPEYDQDGVVVYRRPLSALRNKKEYGKKEFVRREQEMPAVTISQFDSILNAAMREGLCAKRTHERYTTEQMDQLRREIKGTSGFTSFSEYWKNAGKNTKIQTTLNEDPMSLYMIWNRLNGSGQIFISGVPEEFRPEKPLHRLRLAEQIYNGDIQGDTEYQQVKIQLEQRQAREKMTTSELKTAISVQYPSIETLIVAIEEACKSSISGRGIDIALGETYGTITETELYTKLNGSETITISNKQEKFNSGKPAHREKLYEMLRN